MSDRFTRWQSIAIGITAYLLSLIFLGAGGAKMLGMETQAEQFAYWGYPVSFMVVIGSCEFVLAILVANPGTRFLGAVGLVGIMFGAIGTHVQALEYSAALAPLALGMMAALNAWATHPVWLDESASEEGTV